VLDLHQRLADRLLHEGESHRPLLRVRFAAPASLELSSLPPADGHVVLALSFEEGAVHWFLVAAVALGPRDLVVIPEAYPPQLLLGDDFHPPERWIGRRRRLRLLLPLLGIARLPPSDPRGDVIRFRRFLAKFGVHHRGLDLVHDLLSVLQSGRKKKFLLLFGSHSLRDANHKCVVDQASHPRRPLHVRVPQVERQPRAEYALEDERLLAERHLTILGEGEAVPPVHGAELVDILHVHDDFGAPAAGAAVVVAAIVGGGLRGRRRRGGARRHEGVSGVSRRFRFRVGRVRKLRSDSGRSLGFLVVNDVGRVFLSEFARSASLLSFVVR